MYHRVAETELDPWELAVSPQNFDQQLQVLRQKFHPMGLQQFAAACQDGKVPDRAVVVTFDDGYVDNLQNAKPLLEKYAIPATVFVAAGHLDQSQEFWWDELERILLRPGTLPTTLNLILNGKQHEWHLQECANYSIEEFQADHQRRYWEAKPGSRLTLYFAIWEQLQPLPHTEQQQALQAIRQWAGDQSSPRVDYRPLTTIELLDLHQNGLVDIGAHTVNHPKLAAHTSVTQQSEIQNSKAKLEATLGHPVNTFAYPFGSYNADTLPIMEAAGFTCACSTVEKSVRKNSRRFELPRFGVGNWSGDEFTKRLSWWLYS